MKKLILIMFLLIPAITCGYNQADVDLKIEMLCNMNPLSRQYQFTEQYGDNGTRCGSILKSIYRFENVGSGYLEANNIFGFRRHGMMRFESIDHCISFAVDRFFRYDYRKTTKQILMGGCYYNLNNQWVCFPGYSHTKSQQYAYWQFVRNRLLLDLD